MGWDQLECIMDCENGSTCKHRCKTAIIEHKQHDALSATAPKTAVTVPADDDTRVARRLRTTLAATAASITADADAAYSHAASEWFSRRPRSTRWGDG